MAPLRLCALRQNWARSADTYHDTWQSHVQQDYNDKTLTLAAYVARDPKTAYVELGVVNDMLPDMPAYLGRSPWDPPIKPPGRVARKDMRELVERGNH